MKEELVSMIKAEASEWALKDAQKNNETMATNSALNRGYIAGRSKSIESEKAKDEKLKQNAIGFAHWKDRHFKRTYPWTGYFYILINHESVKLIPGVLDGKHYSFEQLYDMYIESQK